MSDKNDTFGINIMQFCRDHEKYIDEKLMSGEVTADTLSWHLEKLRWLQHERLIHLLVTMLTAVVFLFTILLEYLTLSVLVYPFLIISFAMTFAYLIHYFRLENYVQHWYSLAVKLRNSIKK